MYLANAMHNALHAQAWVQDPMDEGFSNDEHTAAVIKKARLHASLEGASGHARSTLSHNFQLPHTARGSAPSGRHANGVMEEAGPQRRAGTTHRPIAGAPPSRGAGRLTIVFQAGFTRSAFYLM